MRIPSEWAYAVSHMSRISAFVSGKVVLNCVARDSISTYRRPNTYITGNRVTLKSDDKPKRYYGERHALP